MFGVAPVFGNIFRESKTTLPAMTEWLLDMSDFFRAGGWIVPIIAAIGIAFIPTTITARIPDRAHRVLCVLIYLILVLMLILLETSTLAVALFLPMVKLIQSLSGGGGGSGL
jgi:type II secretory pathway component PulF